MTETSGTMAGTSGALRERDESFMRRALELAERGRGATSPNPVVGAVIVRDGDVVGEGFHERCGGPHAEVNALAEASELASGATLYVTLEPCSVTGRTPPCTDAILAAGVARVVVPVEDPNPLISGRGISILRSAGVAVELGLLSDEALCLNAPYFKFRRTGLPFTTLKMAVSLDGRIAPPPGGPRWTSSSASRELVQAMRGESDCVMVGIGTVLADDPQLTDRRESASRTPARLVLDTELRIPPRSALVQSARSARTIVACAESADAGRRHALEGAGVEVWAIEREAHGVDIRQALSRAAEAGMLSVLAEGGAGVAGSLLDVGLVDRVAVFIAARFYGSEGTAALPALGEQWWARGAAFENCSWTEIGGDCLFRADVAPRDWSE